MGKAQSGLTCSGAMNLSNTDSCYSLSIVAPQNLWVKFQATSAHVLLSFNNASDTSTSYRIDSIIVFNSGCNPLDIIVDEQRDSITRTKGYTPEGTNGEKYFEVILDSLIVGNYYYINIVLKSAGCLSCSDIIDFNLCIKNPLACPSVFDGCNLVVNGKFEDYSPCPCNYNGIYSACGWEQPAPVSMNSTDYWNACATGGCGYVHLPSFSQNARSGVGCAGFIAYFPSSPSTREYVQQKLFNPLVAGKTYYFEMYVAASEALANYYVDKMGVYITTTRPTTASNTVIPVSATIENPSGSYITGFGWTKVSGCYTASGGEQYITIGTFLSVSAIGFTNPNVSSSTQRPYYFLDDVSLTLLNTDPGSNQTIACAGDQVTLGDLTPACLIPGEVYNWTPATGLSNPNILNPIATPPTTTTYTLTTSIPGAASCNASESVTVTVLPQNLINAGPDAVICVGSSTVLNATGGSGYSWAPSTGLSCNTCSNPTANPSITTTYTLTGTNPNGCVETDQVVVTVNPLPSAPSVSGSLSACNLTGNNYSITNFNSSYTYTIDFFPLPANGTSSPIDVLGNFTVTWSSSAGGTISISVTDPITGCSNTTDFYVAECCYFGTHTFIDGDDALDINTVYGSYSIINQQFSINGVFTVNQNMIWTDCDVKLGPNAIINILPGFTLYLTGNNGFTHLSACGNMWDKISIQSGGVLRADLATLIEDAKTAIYSVAGGIYQLDGVRLNRNYKHMELTAYSGAHPGTIINTKLTCQPIAGSPVTLNPPYLGYRTAIGIDINGVQSVQIGSGGVGLTNNFSNMNLGIQTNKSSVQVYNNSFKSIDLGVFPNTGIAAIQATGNSIFPSYVARTLTVGDGTALGTNTFKDCLNGIVATQNMNASIRLNDFKQINVKGIFISRCSKTNTVLIEDNDFKTTAIGIHCLNNTICNTSIRLNKMTNMKNFSTGVWLQEITAMSIGAVYTVFNNTIKTVEYGVRAENLSRATIDNNTIETEAYTPAFLRSIGIEISGNSGTRITSNTVKIVPINYATKNGGISASISPGSYIYCNTVKDMGYGIKCAGTMPSDIFSNTMSNDFYGLWLDNNGFIGAQDNPSVAGQPSYNKWLNIPVAGSGTTSKRTATTLLTDGSLSPIVYKTGAFPSSLNALYNPNPTQGLTGSVQFTLTPTSSGASAVACPALPLSKLLKSAQDIALENINFPGNDANSKWLNKHGLLLNIKNDNIDVSSDPILLAFVNQSVTDNLGKLIDLNSTITDPTKYNTSDMTTAQAISSSISPNNDIETNQKLINDIVINNYLAGISYTSAQIADLRILANKCPFTDGVGVYQARVLLSEIDSIGTVYNNPCETGEEVRSMTNESLMKDQNTLLMVYPNPATNQLTVKYQAEATDEVVFEIYNLMGEKVISQALNANKNEQAIAVSLLNSGVYFYKFSINGRNVKTSKLVIVK